MNPLKNLHWALSELQKEVNPLIKPYSALLVTPYWALRRAASAERVGQGELGGVTRRWWLLGLAVKAPWLGPGGPILALAAWTGLENATLTL